MGEVSYKYRKFQAKILLLLMEVLPKVLTDINSAFTLATSEPCQTGLVSFLKADISRTTGVSVVLLILAFENETKPVWHSSEVASVNALLDYEKMAATMIKVSMI